MSRPDEPHMHDPADKDLHRKEGVDPYPAPTDAQPADRPQDDGLPTKPQTGDGNYTDAVDTMKKVLKEDGDVDAWRKGRTQN